MELLAATVPEVAAGVPLFTGGTGPAGAPPPLAVIIPALNEEEAIGQVLDELPRRLVRHAIVVDNGSTDATSAAARAHGAHVVREPRRGYGAACWRGIEALPAETRFVVFLDGDHSDYPEALEALVRPLLAGAADLVIGSRTLGGAEPGALFPQQRFGNWLATGLIRLRTGRRYTDLGPFRALTREALARLELRDRAYGWTVEMQLKAPRLGLRVQEVGVRYRKRIGRSKITGTFGGSARAAWTILRVIWRQT